MMYPPADNAARVFIVDLLNYLGVYECSNSTYIRTPQKKIGRIGHIPPSLYSPRSPFCRHNPNGSEFHFFPTDQTLQFAGWGFGLPMSRAFIQYFGVCLPGHSNSFIALPAPVLAPPQKDLKIFSEKYWFL